MLLAFVVLVVSRGDSPTIGKRWQNEPMACAMSGFFFLQASASPLLIGFHATAEVASRARTRRVKSLIGKRILGSVLRVRVGEREAGLTELTVLHESSLCLAHDVHSWALPLLDVKETLSWRMNAGGRGIGTSLILLLDFTKTKDWESLQLVESLTAYQYAG